MAIKAKITVGGKLVLSMDSNPTLSGGTPAPIGSQALVNIAGVGSTWIKSGSNDIDWLMIATGISEDGWNMVYNANDLDAPVANAFFGSSATAFDGEITFVRRGNTMMKFLTNNKISIEREMVFAQNSATISFANNLLIGDVSNTKSIYLLASELTFNSGLSGKILEYYSGTHRRYKAGKISAYFQPTIAPLVVPFAVANAGQLFSKEAILNIRILMKKISDNSNACMFRKTIALASDGTVMSFDFVQDEFTFIKPALDGLNLTLQAGAVFGTIEAVISGYAEASNYQMVLMIDSEAFES